MKSLETPIKERAQWTGRPAPHPPAWKCMSCMVTAKGVRLEKHDISVTDALVYRLIGYLPWRRGG